MSAYDTYKNAILGNPFEPNKKPSRQGAVEAFAEMQKQLEGAQSGAIVKDTLANLQGLTSVIAANVMAWVVNDPVQSKNGIYENTGSDVAPVWARRSDIPQFIISASNVAGSANAITASTDLPIPVENGRCLIMLPIIADNTGSVTVKFNGGLSKTFKTVTGETVQSGMIKNGMVVAGYILNSEFRLISDVNSSINLTAIEQAAAAALVSEGNAAVSAGNASNDAAAALAAAGVSGNVVFYDNKSDANIAVGGLPNGQIAEVTLDESQGNTRTRYRNETGSLVLKAHLSIDAIPNLTTLKNLTALHSDQVARLVDNRLFGHWKWRGGDMSSFVSGDPYGGLWVAPTTDETGASGAWQRMVEKDTYDAEWWLPDAMPAGADIYLNSGILAIPVNYGIFLLPRRTVTTSGPVRFAKGLTYEGFGQECPINGGGGGFFAVHVMANNSVLKNISAGNVAGQLSLGEPGGFHVYDGFPNLDGSGGYPRNISAHDCHAFDAECGFRVGQSPEGDGTAPGIASVNGSREVYLENFRSNNTARIGIEVMRGVDVQIIGGLIEMGIPDPVVGFDRGVRLVGAQSVQISNLHIKSPGSTTVFGVSIEMGGPTASIRAGCSDISVEGVRIEDTDIGVHVSAGARNINIRGCNLVGRRADGSRTAFAISATKTDETMEFAAARTVSIKGCQVSNFKTFAAFNGLIYDLDIAGNSFISNGSGGERFFDYTSGIGQAKLINAKVTGNTGILSPTNTGGTLRIQNLSDDSDITIDDNDFTADASGSVFTAYGTGNGIIRMRDRHSNRVLPDIWADARPALAPNNNDDGGF